jgi:hypothetical protein
MTTVLWYDIINQLINDFRLRLFLAMHINEKAMSSHVSNTNYIIKIKNVDI